MQRWMVLGVIALVVAWILFIKMLEPLPSPPVMPNQAPAAVSTDRPAVPERDSVAATPSPITESAPVAAAAHEIAGTVVLVEDDGTVRAGESGTMEIAWWQEDREQRYTVMVDKGGWRLLVPTLIQPRIERLTMAGKAAWAEDIFMREASELEVRAHWLLPVRIHVVDAETHDPLSDITIVRTEWSPELDSLQHPGAYESDRVVQRHAASPCDLTPDPGPAHAYFHVMAPGHAWQLIGLRREERGERTVTLPVAARLEVQIENPEVLTRMQEQPGRAAPRVCVSGERERDMTHVIDGMRELFGEEVLAELGGEEEWIAEFKRGGVEDRFARLPLAASAPTVIEDLSAGPCTVTVELGNLVLGSAATDVRAAMTTVVRLRLTPPPEHHAPAPLAGRILLPAAWHESTLGLELELLDRPDVSYDDAHRFVREIKPSAEAPGAFAFDAGKLVPGRYRVEVGPTSWTETIELPPAGRSDFEIVVPEPANLCVRVVDDATGSVLELVRDLSWKIVVGKDVIGPSGGFAYPGNDRVFRWRAPVGRVQIEIGGDHVHEEIFELHPGDNEITVRVHKTYDVVIELRERGSRISCPREVQRGITVQAIDGDGHGREHGSGTMLTSIVVDRPGRYRVTFPPLAGYQPIAPFEIEVKAYQPNQAVVDLVKKP